MAINQNPYESPQTPLEPKQKDRTGNWRGALFYGVVALLMYAFVVALLSVCG